MVIPHQVAAVGLLLLRVVRYAILNVICTIIFLPDIVIVNL